jgi:hypothetical protein
MRILSVRAEAETVGTYDDDDERRLDEIGVGTGDLDIMDHDAVEPRLVGHVVDPAGPYPARSVPPAMLDEMGDRSAIERPREPRQGGVEIVQLRGHEDTFVTGIGRSAERSVERIRARAWVGIIWRSLLDHGSCDEALHGATVRLEAV